MDDAETWAAMVREGKNETLDPSLEPYVEATGPLGPMLRHPLVYQVPYFNPGMANRALRNKREALSDALDRGDLGQVIWLHERAYRTEALVRYVVGTDDEGVPLPLAGMDQETRDLAASVWVDSENLGQVDDTWEALLRDPIPGRLTLASVEEQAEFASLSDPLTVYRGEIEDGGYSWSLDRRIAEFFARRFGDHHEIVQGTVAKVDVFGFLTRRNESEVLVAEGKVSDVRSV